MRSTSGSSEDLRSETTTKPDAISLDLAASVIEDDPFADQEGHAGQPQYSEAEGYFFLFWQIFYNLKCNFSWKAITIFAKVS